MKAAARTFVIQPTGHLARVAQWAARRLATGALGAHRGMPPPVRPREDGSAHCQMAFVDTEAGWRCP